MSEGCKSRFVADGYSRAWRACWKEAEKEIQDQYRERFESAGFFRKLQLRHQMNMDIHREVKRRMSKVSPYSNFFTAGPGRPDGSGAEKDEE